MRPIEIKGFSNYAVSEEGVVQNTSTGNVLRTDLNSSGYKRVTMMQDGKRLRIFIHKLVAIHYVDKTDNKDIVNHIDGNKLNNHYTNLEWCTHSENRKHAFKKRLCKRPNSYLNDEVVHGICSMIQVGRPAKEVMRVFNIKKHIYDDIHSRRYYKDIANKYVW